MRQKTAMLRKVNKPATAALFLNKRAHASCQRDVGLASAADSSTLAFFEELLDALEADMLIQIWNVG